MYYIVLLETWGDSKAIKNLPDDHNNKQAVLPWQPYCGHFQTEHKGDCFLFIGLDNYLALSVSQSSFWILLKILKSRNFSLCYSSSPRSKAVSFGKRQKRTPFCLGNFPKPMTTPPRPPAFRNHIISWAFIIGSRLFGLIWYLLLCWLLWKEIEFSKQFLGA